MSERWEKKLGQYPWDEFEEAPPLEYLDEKGEEIPSETVGSTLTYNPEGIPELINKLMPVFLIGAGLLAVAAVGLILKDKTDKPVDKQLPKVKTITKTIYKKVKDEPKQTTKIKDPKKKIETKDETVEEVEEIEEI